MYSRLMLNTKVCRSLHSDQKEFYTYVDQLYSLFLGNRFLVDHVHTFLIIIHQDSSADVYVNDFPISLRVLAKGDMRQSQSVTNKDIADIDELRFDGITIRTDDSVVSALKEDGNLVFILTLPQLVDEVT